MVTPYRRIRRPLADAPAARLQVERHRRDMTADLAVVNGRLVVASTAKDAALMIEDGHIAAIGELPAAWSGRTIDAQGMVVAPGFIDIQLNGSHGYDFTTDGDSIWQVAGLLPQQGVTSFLPTVISSPPDSVNRALWAIAAPPLDGPGATPLGLHLEGPFLNPARRGAHPDEYLRAPSVDLVADWRPQSGVVMVTIAPELPGALGIIRQLAGRGVTVAAGHSDATSREAAEAASAGVGHITHLYNAMSPLHHRDPGLVGFALARHDITASIIVDGLHCHPTAVAAAWNAKGSDGLVLATDANAARGMPDCTGHAASGGLVEAGEASPSSQPRQRAPSLGSSPLTADGGATRTRDCVLAGSLLTMPQAIRNLIEYTGCEITEAIAAATSTPARVIGANSKGALAVGGDADIVVLDENLDAALTIVGGHIVYDPLNLGSTHPWKS